MLFEDRGISYRVEMIPGVGARIILDQSYETDLRFRYIIINFEES
ncbi:MAG: hypothetical protein N3A71_03875 [Candidatus Dojkabacteria bacterium]|nr:hypothetical protein [Candidatus Dojkabacteria bacterium]